MAGSVGIRMNAEDRAEIARGLLNAVEGEVRFDAHNRMLYATDASLYQVEPIGVVIPASVGDAVRAVEWCGGHGVAMLPRGGGTSLAGQCTNRAVVIDFSANCRGISSIDAAGGRARVEPGITVDELNAALAESGLFFAPDPATSRHANVGGCIGNNAAGARSIRYGRTSESVIAVEACLADGTRMRFDEGAALRDERALEITRRVAEVVLPIEALIRERFPRTVRRNAGYGLDMVLAALEAGGAGAWWKREEIAESAASGRGERGGKGGGGNRIARDTNRRPLPPELLSRVNLAHLLCGSEGTLAVTLGAELRLHPLPRARGLALLSFSDLDEAIAAVGPILETKPTAVELLDDTVIDLASANAEYRRYVELMPRPVAGALRAVLYVEYFGQREDEVREQFAALSRAAPGVASRMLSDAGEMARAWKLRKAGEPLLHGVAGNRKPITFVEDNAIPVEHLSEFVREMRRITERHGTIAAYYAHASVGVLHVRPLIDIHDEKDRERMRAIAVEAADLAQRLGGVMSGEHGDGRVRGPLLERFYGPEIMRAFREVKAIFDPKGLLNPGMVVGAGPVESLTQRLRVMPNERPVDVPPGVETYFDYSDQHGFRDAVEMCNGAGVCRKKQGGTMCPSYMATLDERHSTRGRGNALRLAITGQFDSRWDDPETIETLRLCLSCKACKTECPSNVDIARLKAEYTAQRYRGHGVPPAARLFGVVRTLNRLGSLVPGVANWKASWGLTRWAAEKLLGIDRRRSLPRFEKSLARRWREEEHGSESRGTRRRTVALFGDCFTMFNEPGIGLASKRVYEAFGYRVVLADAGCCGRAKISSGLLGAAIEEIDATLERLRPLVEDESVEAVLVAEPSCLSAMRDDWMQLKLRTPLALRRKLAAKAFLPEDFLDRMWESHPARPCFETGGGEVLLHGHCHQKALWGVQTSERMLRRVAGESLRVLDSGCCGMAGAFGFTADRFDLSMRIGELVLFPAVRAEVEADVVAPGTSCRHQVKDGTGRVAVHPMEWLAARLKP